MQEKIKDITAAFDSELLAVDSLKSLEEFRIKFLSRNGLVANLFEQLKSVPKDEKPRFGKELNIFRSKAQKRFDDLKSELETKQKDSADKIDLTMPGRKVELGSKHLIMQILDDIKKIFVGLGFSVHEGPELESDFNNFGALNFPPDHPARDMQDTYFINEAFLLRTHTSPVQVRLMSAQEPPIRAIMPGRVYRNEDINARSYNLFHQVEGLYVDKDVNFAELKGTLVAFARQLYGSKLNYRFRTSFFPFTEPSAEMDITCFICEGKGCRICKYTGWLEILGCGMVDPNVFKSVGYDSEKWTGYAFGMGIERIGLLKYNIDDIRYYFDNDLRFLKQF